MELWKGCPRQLMVSARGSGCSWLQPGEASTIQPEPQAPHSSLKGTGSSSHSPVTRRCVSCTPVYTGVLGQVGQWECA